MKSMMMSLLEKESPSERIKAVSLAQEMAAIDDKIIDALFKTLNHDANANVRLEALDALVRYASMAGVRSRLIESLQYQQSPLVQLALADIMVLLQDEEARRALQDLANDQETTDEVKLQIEDRIKAISL